MKLLQYSILALATAAALSSCDNGIDNEYVAGAASNGAYFSTEAPTDYEVSLQATSVAVTVNRTGDTAAATYGITATTDAAEGVLSFPASVSFDEGAASAQYVIACDFSNCQAEDQFNVALAFADGTAVSAYGDASCSFTITIEGSWSEWEAFEAGLGTYEYMGWPMTGDDPDLPIEYRYNLNNDNLQEFVIHHWGPDMDFYFSIDKSTGYLSIPIQNTGYVINSEFDLYFTDMYTYTGDDSFQDYGFYDEETGTFYLPVVYFSIEDGEPFLWAGTGNGSYGYEYFQMDGYADTSLSMNYSGLFTDAYGKTSAIINANVGEGATEARFAASNALSANDLANAIVAGQVEYVTAQAGNDQTISIPVTGYGEFVAVGVTFLGDEPMNATSVDFTIASAGGEDADWEAYATGEIIDGWWTAAFADASGTPIYESYPWPIEIQRNKEDHNIYRMVNVWTSEYCPILDFNVCPAPANITIDCTDPNNVWIAPQKCGFAMEGIDLDASQQFYIANSYVMLGTETESGATVTAEDIIANGYNAVMDEDGIINLPRCFFGETAEKCLYAWTYRPYGVIYLGDPSQNAVRRFQATRKAKDIAGVNRALNPVRAAQLKHNSKVQNRVNGTISVDNVIRLRK